MAIAPETITIPAAPNTDNDLVVIVLSFRDYSINRSPARHLSWNFKGRQRCLKSLETKNRAKLLHSTVAPFHKKEGLGFLFRCGKRLGKG
jgi:hypothetical protein